jgi:hypothetical protein
VPAYVREHIVSQLNAIGLDVQASESGERVLQSQLVEFWVAEGNRHRGSVRLRVIVADANGKELWSALVGGSSDHFGRSLKPDNYAESLSDELQDLAAQQVSASGFPVTLARKTP